MRRRRRGYWMGGFATVAIACASFYLHKPRPIAVVTVSAWRLSSGLIFIAEDSSNPQLQAYRQQEQLEGVVHHLSSDFQRILTLAQWSSHQFVASAPAPKYPPWNGRVILDWIRGGKTGGYCAQYAFVFGQACQSFGYQPRYLDIASPEGRGGHFTTEVYVPSLKRWIVFEPEWGYYYADHQGYPLDALDLHRFAVGKQKGDIYKLPTKEKVNPGWLRLFYYIRYYLRNNFLTVPVFVKFQPTGQILFEKYRLAWKDAYTDNQADRKKAIFSSDLSDFRHRLTISDIGLVTCQNAADFYRSIRARDVFTIYRFSLPSEALFQMVANDFVHDTSYHPLESD